MPADGVIPAPEELGSDGFMIVKAPRTLQSRVLRQGLAVAGANDAIRRAEQALEDLAPNFTEWADAESVALVALRDAARADGYSAKTREALFRKAHDIKGQAGTLGFPAAGEMCSMLCRLVDRGLEDPAAQALADHHVDAVRATVRMRARGDDPAARQVIAALAEASALLAARRRPKY